MGSRTRKDRSLVISALLVRDGGIISAECVRDVSPPPGNSRRCGESGAAHFSRGGTEEGERRRAFRFAATGQSVSAHRVSVAAYAAPAPRRKTSGHHRV